MRQTSGSLVYAFYEYRKPTFPDVREQSQEIYEYHKILRLYGRKNINKNQQKETVETLKITNTGYPFSCLYLMFLCQC